MCIDFPSKKWKEPNSILCTYPVPAHFKKGGFETSPQDTVLKKTEPYRLWF